MYKIVGLVDKDMNIFIDSVQCFVYSRNIDGIDYLIVLDGELKNKEELAKLIEDKGIHLNSDILQELVLLSYVIWKADIVKKIDGIYALAIWNDRKKELVLARDKMGYKPLFYFKAKDKLIFSSDIEGILSYPVVDKRVNIKSVNAGRYVVYNKQGLYENLDMEVR